jgi:hypothetical protein
MATHVTKTFLRTEETMERYMKVAEERKLKGEIVNPFLNWRDHVVKEFNHWVIVTNEFPYDRVAEVSHMIATKREIAFDWHLLNEEEKFEFETIKSTYLAEHYDALWENLPKGSTVSHHFHLHVIVLRRVVN